MAHVAVHAVPACACIGFRKLKEVGSKRCSSCCRASRGNGLQWLVAGVRGSEQCSGFASFNPKGSNVRDLPTLQKSGSEEWRALAPGCLPRQRSTLLHPYGE